MSPLPPELYAPILANVDENYVLARIACVSKHFLEETERILYRAIHVRASDAHIWAGRLGATRQRRADAVRTLSFNADGTMQLHPRTVRAVRELLSRLRHLATLHLPLGWEGASQLTLGVRVPFNLRVLTAGMPALPFLATQTDLVELAVTSEGYLSSTGESVIRLPSLRKLECWPGLVELLLAASTGSLNLKVDNGVKANGSALRHLKIRMRTSKLARQKTVVLDFAAAVYSTLTALILDWGTNDFLRDPRLSIFVTALGDTLPNVRDLQILKCMASMDQEAMAEALGHFVQLQAVTLRNYWASVLGLRGGVLTRDSFNLLAQWIFSYSAALTVQLEDGRQIRRAPPLEDPEAMK